MRLWRNKIYPDVVVSSERWSLRARLLFVTSLLLICPRSVCGAVRASQADDAPAELRRGNYERAIELFRARLSTEATDETAQRGILRAFLEIGRYGEAEELANKIIAAHPEAAYARQGRAEIYAATGRYSEAVSEFEKAGIVLAKKAPAVQLETNLRRAEIMLLIGHEDEAKALLQSIVASGGQDRKKSAAELTAIASALAHLERYKEANDYLQEAIEGDPSFIEAQLGGGELFTEKYNYAEAAEFFREALKINSHSARAYLGIAVNKQLEGGPEMIMALARALELNPNMVAAKTFGAKEQIEAGRYETASTQLAGALKINPNSLEAHSLKASILYLQDADNAAEIKSVLAINPHYGELYDTLAHFATINRRYQEAARFARQAVALSPKLWRAHLSLGMALMRIGRVKEGREAIEVAFRGDPFNVWAKNTLDLLDTMRDFGETRQGDFIVKAAAKEHPVLAAYASDLLKEAAQKLNAKYGFTPQGPILVEMFANHEDFAVRALGLPGLGALGVCFGQVIALDSPTARPAGEFNWGSTLWHEYTHVITLQMTQYRVPRWLSEGLSVYEERRGRPGWGDDWNAMVLKALGDKRWFKIADLDAGFQQPRTPQDVPLAYFQASQICEFIAERYGFEAILKMLAQYRDKADTKEAIGRVLKLSEEEFDRALMDYVQGKVGRYVQALAAAQATIAVERLSKDEVLALLRGREDFLLHLRAGGLLQAEGAEKEAAEHCRRSLELFPYQAGADNSYEKLAALYEKLGDSKSAASTLELLIRQDENNLPALRKLAGFAIGRGDHARAGEVLQLAFYINPLDSALHTMAGEQWLALREPPKAVGEFQVALTLKPPNEAEAYYNLARAQMAAGQKNEAKRSVLRALEVAPSYEQAQELLLKISGQ